MSTATKIAALKILLVEDNPSDVFLLRTAMVKAGLHFDLMVIADGAEALAHVDRMCRDGTMTCPDVILLDLNLPKYDGLEVLRHIRRSPALAGVPVAIYTSSDSPADRLASDRLGVSRYIVKPSQLKELASVAGIVDQLGRAPRDTGGTAPK